LRNVLQKIDAYYTASLSAHGPTPRGVDWNSAESQSLRFDRLATAIPQTGPVTVLDYGCGYGAFCEFLANYNPSARYVGYDVSDAMIAAAQKIHGDRVEFTSDSSTLQPAGVVVASGIFNVRMDVTPAAWEAYIFETLERIALLAKEAFAFNMLTIYSDAEYMRGDLYYGDPHVFFDWCQKRYGRWVATLHDYGLYEFTTIARKAPARSEPAFR